MECFNPRSHEGSDVISLNGTFNSYVSIHAPTKGATTLDAPYIVDKCVSIHAPTKGATYNSDMSKIDAQMFQSTLPRRERHKKIYTKTDYSRVSIHAPTKGATLCCTAFSKASICFNPRSHEGSDYFNPADISKRKLFQSTLPRRERQSEMYSGVYAMVFQSTLPRRERRKVHHSDHHTVYVSIHAPTKGATPVFLPPLQKFPVSIHAPTKGATNNRAKGLVLLFVSIHAPTKGATAII